MQIRRVGEMMAAAIAFGVLAWSVTWVWFRMSDPLPNLTLGEAAARGEDARVWTALAAGARVNGLGAGWTPLMLAADGGHASTVRLLLSAGADVNQVDNRGWIALHVAAMQGRTEVLAALLSRGADVRARTAAGETALPMAEARHHDEAVRLRKRWGAR